MVREIIVILRGKCPHHGKSPSRNPGKVMMLIVISNIPADEVEWTIIGVCFNSFNKDIMLGDEVTCHWMKAHA